MSATDHTFTINTLALRKQTMARETVVGGGILYEWQHFKITQIHMNGSLMAYVIFQQSSSVAGKIN